MPGERVVALWAEAVADHGDRPLARGVHVHHAAPLRLLPERGLDPQAEVLERGVGAVAELVVAERGEEGGLAAQLGQLHGRHGPAPTRFLPDLARMDDLTGQRHTLDAYELDPLHMSDDCRSHLQG